VSGLLDVREAVVVYPPGGAGPAAHRAVDGVSFVLGAGEFLGLVGESGCGKTSLGRAILGLSPLAAGEIRWQGRRIDALPRRGFRALRRELQLVFQDPHASLDPRMTIGQSVAEPLRALARGLSPAERAERVGRILGEVGLAAEHAARYPHQLSGGQLQRAGIARALVVDPRFVVCDEPVSALDVSVQGQIVNLLARIRRERGLSGLFISHNLAVVACLSERILVLYGGRIVESAPRAALLAAPRHPYTRLLLDSVPTVDPASARRLASRAASPAMAQDARDAPGCAFAARCPHAEARCRVSAPFLRAIGPDRQAACHRAEEWPGGLPSLAET
jgi:oligopeptide/dipeptide ABC transporter ATP-binding protein